MSKIKHITFDGIRPSISPRLLPENGAQTCENIDLGAGRLDPWKVPLLVQASVNAVSIFPWRRNNTTEWLSWAIDTDVVQSPIADDQYERIYITDGVKPVIIGWDSVKTQKDMERPTATAPTATATDRTGFGATEMATATAVFGGTVTGTYRKTVGGVTTDETITPFALNWIGTLLQATRDKYTGAWTVDFTFYPDSSWTFSGPIGTRITNIVATLAGSWTITLDGDTVTLGGSITLNDGSVDYGTALVAASLPTPTLSIGKASVTGDTVTGSLQFIPTFFKDTSVKYVYYVQTLIDDWGMEGPASTVSNQVTWLPGQKVVIGNLGDLQGCTKRRLYRSAAGLSEDTFYYLTELTNESSYTDILTDAELAEEIPLFENPPDAMKGIVMMPANFAAAFMGRELLFSEPDYPWSWPSEYRLTVDWDVVGLGVLGNDLYVMTTGNPYIVTGFHPESLTIAKIAIPQSCVAKRSVAPLGQYMMYASPDGLVGLSGGGARLLTEPHYSRGDWQALTPANMISAVHDGCYFGFLGTTGITFWLGKGDDSMATIALTTAVTEAHFDLEDDTLYIVQGGSIYSWNRGATNLTMKWRGKEWVSDVRQDWNSARIEADGYNVTLRLYAENALVQTVTVTTHDSVRLPKMQPERIWSIEVESSVAAINMVAVGTSKRELIG